jgi:hypothetical protein
LGYNIPILATTTAIIDDGVITGFEKALDVGTPIIKRLTQEARDYVNSPEQLTTT